MLHAFCARGWAKILVMGSKVEFYKPLRVKNLQKPFLQGEKKRHWLQGAVSDLDHFFLNGGKSSTSFEISWLSKESLNPIRGGNP